MRVKILSLIAKLLGIQFKIYGLPFGADYRTSYYTLKNHPTLGKWGGPDPDDQTEAGCATTY